VTGHGPDGPVLLVGCGRLGSAIVEGWLEFGPIDPRQLMILTPSAKPVCEFAARKGSLVNPSIERLCCARVVVLAVKPALWRQAVRDLPSFGAGTVIISVMAGVPAKAIEDVMQLPVARAMPTTAVARGQGVVALWSGSREAAGSARALFAPVADVVELGIEAQIDIATAVSGSGPAYVHAFTLALAAAGEEAGLSRTDARRLARGAVRSAAAASDEESLEDLIARIASPGGTTRAGLTAARENDLDGAVKAAVAAALSRARELASS